LKIETLIVIAEDAPCWILYFFSSQCASQGYLYHFTRHTVSPTWYDKTRLHQFFTFFESRHGRKADFFDQSIYPFLLCNKQPNYM